MPVSGRAPAELGGCSTGGKAIFLVKDEDGFAKDLIKWTVVEAGPFVQADLGDPIATTIYSLCIYDEGTGAS